MPPLCAYFTYNTYTLMKTHKLICTITCTTQNHTIVLLNVMAARTLETDLRNYSQPLASGKTITSKGNEGGLSLSLSLSLHFSKL